MNRRTFLCGLTLGALSAPLAAEAQQTGKVYRIGIMAAGPAPHLRDPFLQALRERGYVEGQNLVIEERWSEGRSDRFVDFASEFVNLKVDVIVTISNPAAQAAKNATDTIQIVMAIIGNPDLAGLVVSLARPGGNVTGLSAATGPEIAGKMLQVLKEAAPKVSRVAVLYNAAPSVGSRVWAERSGALVKEIDTAGHVIGVKLQPVPLTGPDALEGVFAAIAGRAEALIVEASGLAFLHRRLIVEYAAKHRMPGVYAFREFAEDGGLLAYGVDLKDLLRRTAGYVDKILKGAKPSELPVEQPTKFELVINLKTAKALGLTIPPSLLLRADQVIE